MLKNVQKLNDKGFKVAIDILGEHVETEIEANEITKRYISIYDEISKRNLSANISIKLTHIGQDLGLNIVKNNLTQLVQAAKMNNNFLRLDMENVPYTSETIQLYKEMFEYYNQIGIVIQAYLHRSLDDIKSLSNEKFNVISLGGQDEINKIWSNEHKKELVELTNLILSDDPIVPTPNENNCHYCDWREKCTSKFEENEEILNLFADVKL